MHKCSIKTNTARKLTQSVCVGGAGFFAINVQGICDHHRQFTYLSANTVRPTHDSTAFATTNVSRKLAASALLAAFHFVGDEAYSGCAEQVVTPYPGRNLAITHPEQDAFNYWLSNSRTEIECAFGAAQFSPVTAAGPL